MTQRVRTNVARTFRLFFLPVLLSSIGMQANATLLTNGDFETGDFSGWTQFTTTGGTLGTGFPNVTPFDTNNDAVATNSAQFRVGGAAQPVSGQEGGGIFQMFNLASAGTVSFSADIAAFDPDGGNSEWGIFTLLIDGISVDSYQFGNNTFPGATTLYSTLSGSAALAAGAHEIRILMTRPFLQNSATPVQYIDNVAATVPVPATLALVGLGLAGIGYRRKQIKAT